MEWIDVKLHTELADAARKLARERDITVGQLVRDLVSREVSRARQARPPVRADERLIAPLRARLAADLAGAKTWEDLDQRLTQKGYRLVPSGGWLVLHSHATGQRICKASELGFSYGQLMQRIGMPFPGDTRTWLTGIPDARSTQTSRKAVVQNTTQARDITEDFDVIEPF